jgi:hypothetical protein
MHTTLLLAHPGCLHREFLALHACRYRVAVLDLFFGLLRSVQGSEHMVPPCFGETQGPNG